jgi:hypothetical protein
MIIKAPASTGTQYTLPNPTFGYTCDYNLATKITKTSDNKYLIWDNGAQFDHSILTCSWLVSLADANTLVNIFKDANKARGGVLDIILSSNSGFYPLGSQGGDSGIYTFIVMEYDQQPTIGHPEDYFYINAKLHSTNYTYSYVSKAQTSLGALQIGTITGLRYPDQYHTSNNKINFVSQITEADNYYQIDRTNADQYESALSLVQPTGNMGAIINHLVTTVRGNTFSIVSPDNAYLFGRENGNTNTCKLIQNTITQTHELHNRWSTTLNFAKVA